MLHWVHDQPTAKDVAAQFDKLLDAVADKLPAVAEHLDAARADVLAFGLPQEAEPLILQLLPVDLGETRLDLRPHGQPAHGRRTTCTHG